MDDNTIICRCEEVTLGQIKKAIACGLTSVSEIRKFTRTGMGLCQGRTCQRNLVGILRSQGISVTEADLPKVRPPVTNVKISELIE